jgi:transcriptional antiterminator NusG
LGLKESKTMADELKQDEEQVVPVGADEALASDVAVDPEVSTEGEAVGGETAGGEVVAAAPVNENFKWYIIHAYSGFERKVKESLQSRVAAYHLEDKVGRIEIPTEPTTELRNGKKYTIDRVFLPGYVFVEMALDNDMWHVVKNTPRVTGFLQTGDQPNALSEAEVNAMLNRSDVTKEKPKLKLKFTKGEQVRITDGPFNNFNGAVDDVNEDKQTLKVMVSIFGRPTPTEVSFANVEKVEA